MAQFFFENQWWIIALVILWSLPWKAVALWKAAVRREKSWFFALLIINTLGILEIFYIFGFSREKRKPKERFSQAEAKKIGKRLGVKWDRFDFDVEQFKMGLDVELEHGLKYPKTNVTNDDFIMTGKIALAHLNELADYYTRLAKMEKESEEAAEKAGD